jgi:hypothetical protein
MAETTDINEWAKKFQQLGWTDDEGNFVRDYGNWGFGMEFAYKQSNPELVKAITDEYGGFYKAPQQVASYLQSAIGNNAKIDDYKKAISDIKNDPSIYYKNRIESAAFEYGRMKSMGDYFGGYENSDASLKSLINEAQKKNINISGWENDLNTKFNSGYASQSGYNNPDLRGGGGFLNKTLNSITSNPVTLFAVPLGAAALSGAFAGAGAGATMGAEASLGTTAGTSAGTTGATNFLGSQALGSASTGAVGSGSTGFGLSAGTATGGAAAGTGISTGALGGMGYLGGAGNLAVGTAGLTAEQIAQAELAGSIGSNASSGMGYLGGAESLPAGTAGITGVTAPTTLSLQDIQRGLRLGQSLLGGQQQPVGQPHQLQRQIKPTGEVDYSPILNLLALRQASTPNVYSLLG